MSAGDAAPGAHAHPALVSDGAKGVAVAYAAERIELWLDLAYPPGRPLAFTVALASGPLALQGKAQGSKRREDGSFEVRVKLVSLRKEDRETLTSVFAAAAAPET